MYYYFSERFLFIIRTLTFFSLLSKPFLSVISVRRFNELVQNLHQLNSIPLPMSSPEISIIFIFFFIFLGVPYASFQIRSQKCLIFLISTIKHSPLIQAKWLYLCTIVIDCDYFMTIKPPKRILKVTILHYYFTKLFPCKWKYIRGRMTFCNDFLAKQVCWTCKPLEFSGRWEH